MFQSSQRQAKSFWVYLHSRLSKQCSRGKYTRLGILSGKLFYFRTFSFFSKFPGPLSRKKFFILKVRDIQLKIFPLFLSYFQKFEMSKFFLSPQVLENCLIYWRLDDWWLMTSSFRIGSLPQFFRCRSWALSLIPSI